MRTILIGPRTKEHCHDRQHRSRAKSTSVDDTNKGFTADEHAAIREHAKELKAAAGAGATHAGRA